MYNLCEKQIYEDCLGCLGCFGTKKVENVYVLLENTYAKESTEMLTKSGSVIEFKGSFDSISLKEN